MRGMKNFALSALLVLGLTLGCSKEVGTPKSTNVDDLVTYDVPLDVDTTDMSTQKLELLQKLKAKQAVQFSEVTYALYEDQLVNHGRRSTPIGIEAFKKFLADNSQGLNTLGNAAIKVAYEERIEKAAGKSLLYNMDAISVGDVVSENRLQCYSGTTLYQLLARQALGAVEFKKRNPVVIMEKGHVLPGYLTAESYRWKLTGIETTSAGPAEIEYGFVDSLTTDIRVVDAESYAVVEAYKVVLNNPVEAANHVLLQTAQRYGIPQVNVKRVEPSAMIPKVARLSNLNWSPFSFGTPKVSPGDKLRVRIEKMKRSDITNDNPNLTISGATILAPSVPVRAPVPVAVPVPPPVTRSKAIRIGSAPSSASTADIRRCEAYVKSDAHLRKLVRYEYELKFMVEHGVALDPTFSALVADLAEGKIPDANDVVTACRKLESNQDSDNVTKFVDTLLYNYFIPGKARVVFEEKGGPVIEVPSAFLPIAAGSALLSRVIKRTYPTVVVYGEHSQNPSAYVPKGALLAGTERWSDDPPETRVWIYAYLEIPSLDPTEFFASFLKEPLVRAEVVENVKITRPLR
jgi:hypothetical protein